MDYENDFVNEEIIDLKIDDRVFKYKPVTAGEENNWLNEVLDIDEETKKPKTNWAKYNECKLLNIVGVPYNKELINKMIGVSVDVDWKDLNKKERLNLFRKLKPGLFDKIINAMKKADEPDEAVKN